MSAKSRLEEFLSFSEHESEVVEFESTWSLERTYDKAIPIPTQTDPVNKSVDKSTMSYDVKHTAVQTETHSSKGPALVDEKQLLDSLRVLGVLMEAEIKLGTTHVFKFQNN